MIYHDAALRQGGKTSLDLGRCSWCVDEEQAMLVLLINFKERK